MLYASSLLENYKNWNTSLQLKYWGVEPSCKWSPLPYAEAGFNAPGPTSDAETLQEGGSWKTKRKKNEKQEPAKMTPVTASALNCLAKNLPVLSSIQQNGSSGPWARSSTGRLDGHWTNEDHLCWAKVNKKPKKKS